MGVNLRDNIIFRLHHTLKSNLSRGVWTDDEYNFLISNFVQDVIEQNLLISPYSIAYNAGQIFWRLSGLREFVQDTKPVVRNSGFDKFLKKIEKEINSKIDEPISLVKSNFVLNF